MQELCALCEELGAGLVPEPLMSSATIVSLLPSPERERALAGEFVVVPAFREPGSADLNARATFADGVVSGLKHVVPFAGGADAFLVTTKDGLALVRKDAKGLVLNLSDTRDGGHFGHIVFDRAEAKALPGSFDVAFEQSALAVAAYLLGASRRLFELSLDYVKVRKQFGRAIGSFQVLQHRARQFSLNEPVRSGIKAQ
jgi:alkylation response protein AidB-like acyl-CoA dehydrogenase